MEAIGQARIQRGSGYVQCFKDFAVGWENQSNPGLNQL
jgi:hypothetical protein